MAPIIKLSISISFILVIFLTGVKSGAQRKFVKNTVLPVTSVHQHTRVRRQEESPTIPESTSGDKWENEIDLIQTIVDGIDSAQIKTYLQFLSEKPHLAATERDDELAYFVRDKFSEAEFDLAELVPYNILLSSYDPQHPNKIKLLRNGEIIFESRHLEDIIPAEVGDNNDDDKVHAFNAYIPAGKAETPEGVGLVYANYGRQEDFQLLEDLGIEVAGHIVIAKFGKIHRGNKVLAAQKAGAIGTILFSDPQDVAPEGTAPENVYDNTFWLPGTGMQRGSSKTEFGDPLTPGWPATEHTFRITREETNLPKIPAQPIGYDDARKLLEIMDGDPAPAEWQGGLEGLTYKFGPKFNSDNVDVSVTLETHNTANITRSYNVIGTIKGSIEPDRYVIIGNHRDAVGYGTIDPSSGTASMLEVVRVFGTLLKDGWKPRRTIIFASWGAEEYGLIGSTEWVEENVDKLQDRAIVYINTDTCAPGPILQISGSPLMWDIALKLTPLVPGVQDPSVSLYDEWIKYNDEKYPDEESPRLTTLGSGSDFAPFVQFAGIPAFDIMFTSDLIKYSVPTSAAYHTLYDNLDLFNKFIDPDYKITQGCGRLVALSVKYMADSSLIPYGISRLPSHMLQLLKNSPLREKLVSIYDKYVELEAAVERLLQSSEAFLTGADITSMSPLELRAVNDQLRKLEQSFILPAGLPSRPNVRHAVFAPSQFDSYSSSGFPGLADLLYGYDALSDEEKLNRDVQIKRHVSDIMVATNRAISLLEEVHLI